MVVVGQLSSQQVTCGPEEWLRRKRRRAEAHGQRRCSAQQAGCKLGRDLLLVAWRRLNRLGNLARLGLAPSNAAELTALLRQQVAHAAHDDCIS